MLNKVKNILHYFRRKPLDLCLYLIFFVAIIKLYSLYFSVNVDDGNWDTFKEAHHCQLRKTKFGNQKASWQCDDGKVYFRWMHQR